MKLKKAFIFLCKIPMAYVIFILLASLLYLAVPPISTLMLARFATFKGIKYNTVKIEDISPQLLRSFIRAEDGKFCTHHGIDWESLSNAIEDKDGHSRGASTIPMQVAKNLFLWPQQSYIRKAIEIPLAMYLDTIWPKSRMMEIYLSIAELGDGVFGIEAAAKKYFNKPAKQLTSHEAALLAAMLPSPLKRNPLKPGPYYLSYANNIEKWANSDVDISCIKKKKKEAKN